MLFSSKFSNYSWKIQMPPVSEYSDCNSWKSTTSALYFFFTIEILQTSLKLFMNPSKIVHGFSYWYHFHIQGTDNSDSIKEELYDTSAGFVLLASNVLVLVSSITSLLYIHVYLKLNVFLKVILYQMTILGILGSAIIIVAVEIILATSKQSFVTCSLIYYPFVFMGTLIVTMTSMISGLRYVIVTVLFYTQFVISKS